MRTRYERMGLRVGGGKRGEKENDENKGSRLKASRIEEDTKEEQT